MDGQRPLGGNRCDLHCRRDHYAAGRCLADHDRPADAAAVSAEHLAVPDFPET